MWVNRMGARYIVSACLAGVRCRYDGEARTNARIAGLVQAGLALPLCPEQLGGLPTPRPPAEIQGGDGHDVLAGKARVINVQGEDVTDAYIRGAQETLHLARLFGATEAILKGRSPSCGRDLIYDGTFQRRLRPGRGVTAACLQEAGVNLHVAD